jgi:hypothetical protein
MKAIVAGIVLLVVVGGAMAYAYNKHIEVSYLTMRADNLERRITQLESASSTGISAEVDQESETEASTASPTPEEKAAWWAAAATELGGPPTTGGLPRRTPEEKAAWWRSKGVDMADIPSTPEVEEPEPTLTPVPDLLFERMMRDQVMQELKAEAPRIARLIAPDTAGRHFELLTEDVELYASVYVASACLEGEEPSTEGFRDMMTTGPDGGWTDHIPQTIRAINEKGQEEEISGCLQPYLYPESMADAAPAIDLNQALVKVGVATRFRTGLEGFYREHAANWFTLPEPRQPFLSWMCEPAAEC